MQQFPEEGLQAGGCGLIVGSCLFLLGDFLVLILIGLDRDGEASKTGAYRTGSTPNLAIWQLCDL